jgi:hypothetical protein
MLRIPGFLDCAHFLVSKQNTPFQKLDLFASRGQRMGRSLCSWVHYKDLIFITGPNDSCLFMLGSIRLVEKVYWTQNLCFHLSLQLLFKTYFAPMNIQ